MTHHALASSLPRFHDAPLDSQALAEAVVRIDRRIQALRLSDRKSDGERCAAEAERLTSFRLQMPELQPGEIQAED